MFTSPVSCALLHNICELYSEDCEETWYEDDFVGYNADPDDDVINAKGIRDDIVSAFENDIL